MVSFICLQFVLMRPAISNVLVSTQSTTTRQRVSKPTSREIPTVTLTNLPHVTYASFEPYLSSISPDYERHRRIKQGLLEEHIRTGSRESSVVPTSPFAELIDSKLLRTISTSNISRTLLDDALPAPSIQPSPRRRPFPRRNQVEEPELLDTVPSVFFDSNFSLANPRTFDIVNENSDLLPRTETGKPDRKSLAINAILQEKLSWYMDTVEVHLIKEINIASTSFFAALSDLQELDEDASRCVSKIAKLREELGRIQEMHALQGADVAKLHIKRANIARLQQMVDLVVKIAGMKERIEDHLERKEHNEAYRLMQDVRAIMDNSGMDPAFTNLRRVEALRNIDAEMANVLSRIGTSQGNDLAKTLITDLRAWVNSTNAQATLRRLSDTFNRDSTRKDVPNISSPAHITVPDDVRATVVVQLQGLQQTRFLETGMELYRKEIVKEVKAVIKKYLPSTDDDTESVMSSFVTNQSSHPDRKERSQALAKNLRQMAPEMFLEMIMATYASLAEFFRRLQTHQKLLLDLTALSGTVPADLSEVLNNIMDISSARIQKILGVRAEQNSHLAPRDFYVFLASARLFSLECERISGKTPTVLMTTVNSQARGFVSWLNLDRTKLLGAAIDRDKWKSEDILPITQKQTSLLVESATRDPMSWVKFIRVDSMDNVNGVNSTESLQKTLTIEEEKFYVVACVVVLLGILEEYCIAIIALPPLQSDIAANLIEVLKVYPKFLFY
jgi:vacuolar protein sorting-associated protein 54